MTQTTPAQAAPAPAGWYHQAGDPPGTVRRWTGLEWIGYPIQEPGADQLAAAGIGGTGPTASAALFDTAPRRRSRLSSGATSLGTITMALLAVMAVLFAAAGHRVWTRVDAIRPFGATSSGGTGRQRDVGDLVDYIPGMAPLMVAIGAVMLVSAPLFIMWLRKVAVVARISQYGRASRRRANRSMRVMVLQWFFFGGFALIWWFLRFAMSGIASATGGNRSMLGIVTDTAMASSADPHTGISRIGPIKIMVWWALWWGPMIVSSGGVLWLWWSGMSAQGLHTFVKLHAALFALEAVSLVLIIATMTQITRHLRR